MATDIFSVGVLNRVVDNIEPVPQFLLRTFFPSVIQSEDEEITFDIRDGAPRIAPFVAPVSQGQIVEGRGYRTERFSPAYVKDKRVFDPNKLPRRAFGERIGGSMSLAERMRRRVAEETQDQEEMFSRRLEVMAGQVLTTGTATIVGDLYPEVVVDFGRHTDLTVTLSGTSEWGDSGVDPLADLRAWQQLLHTRGKVRPTNVVMTPDAWELFVASDSVQDLFDSLVRREGTSRNSDLPIITDEAPQGTIGGFTVTVYQGEYVDPMDNTLKQILPDYTVILGDRRMDGVQHFGAIKDEAAGLQARRTFTKSWITEDPPVRYIMLQSAPLLVPYRKDALLSATVKQ
jgi:hypothetical protein